MQRRAPPEGEERDGVDARVTKRSGSKRSGQLQVGLAIARRLVRRSIAFTPSEGLPVVATERFAKLNLADKDKRGGSCLPPRRHFSVTVSVVQIFPCRKNAITSA